MWFPKDSSPHDWGDVGSGKEQNLEGWSCRFIPLVESMASVHGMEVGEGGIWLPQAVLPSGQ